MHLNHVKQQRLLHSLIRILKKPLWTLPIVCMIIISCNFFQQPSPPPKVIACGTIPNPLPRDASSVQPLGTCFWEAFRQCQVATLTYTDQEEKTHIFSISKNMTQCKIFDTVQQTKGSQKTFTYTCAQLQAFRGGAGALMFINCAKDKNITVPINNAIQ